MTAFKILRLGCKNQSANVVWGNNRYSFSIENHSEHIKIICA